jgi:hypothetical protein
MNQRSFMAVLGVFLLSAFGSHAAKTTGNVKVLCIRVPFDDYKNAPGLTTITNRIRGAETQFEKFSFGKMDVTYDTETVTLGKRGPYTAGELAAAGNKVPGSGLSCFANSPMGLPKWVMFQ